MRWSLWLISLVLTGSLLSTFGESSKKPIKKWKDKDWDKVQATHTGRTIASFRRFHKRVGTDKNMNANYIKLEDQWAADDDEDPDDEPFKRILAPDGERVTPLPIDKPEMVTMYFQ